MPLREALESRGERGSYLVSGAMLAGLMFDDRAIGYGRGRKGAHRPEPYQFVPADLFITPWLSEVPGVAHVGGEAGTLERRRLLIADEGGMGKTCAAALCARDEMLRGGAVLVIGPRGLQQQWMQEFRRLGLRLDSTSVPKLQQGRLEAGKAYYLRRGGLLKKDLDLARYPHLADIGLCVLDEAHYGTIAAALQDEDGGGGGHQQQTRFQTQVLGVFKAAQRGLALSATPMRNAGDENLRQLLKLIVDDEDLAPLGIALDMASVKRWLHLLSRWERGAPEDEGCMEGLGQEALVGLMNAACPLLSNDDAEHVASMLLGPLPEPEIRCRVARDLHPYGKYFHCTVRDDLGADVVGERFRQRRSLSHFFDETSYEATEEYREESTAAHRSCALHRIEDVPVAHHGTIKDAWSNDPRLQRLREILDLAVQDGHAQPQRFHGVVVFTHWLSAVDGIAEWARNHVPDGVKVFQTSTTDEGQPDENTVLRNVENAAKRGAVPLLICSDRMAEGRNMLWASRIVHWDLWGGAEHIAQRSWRVDRRLGHERERVSNTFYVHHFVTNGDDVARLNADYANDRAILGDRRYLVEGGGPLLPPGEEEMQTEWSPHPRPLVLSSSRIQLERQRADGEEADPMASVEYLWHTVLDVILEWGGLHLADHDAGPYERSIVSEVGHRGRTRERADWHRLAWLASPEERPHLLRLSRSPPRTRRENPIPLSLGPEMPLGERTEDVLLLRPNGGLLNTILLIAFPDLDALHPPSSLPISRWRTRHVEELTLVAIDLDAAIHRLRKTPTGVFREVFWGPEAHSGLLVKKGDGAWEPIECGDMQARAGHWGLCNALTERRIEEGRTHDERWPVEEIEWIYHPAEEVNPDGLGLRLLKCYQSLRGTPVEDHFQTHVEQNPGLPPARTLMEERPLFPVAVLEPGGRK